MKKAHESYARHCKGITNPNKKPNELDGYYEFKELSIEDAQLYHIQHWFPNNIERSLYKANIIFQKCEYIKKSNRNEEKMTRAEYMKQFDFENGYRKVYQFL